VAERVRALQLESPDVPRDLYLAKLSDGGIVEERICRHEIRSPSVQLRITPDGKVELLSTHDQLLGGPSGQSYLGCMFPADPGYAKTISRYSTAVAERLVPLKVTGRFAFDFVAVRETDGTWAAYAIELNLRKGGTMHPFLTLQFLTDGRYDPATALFMTSMGTERHLVATDHVESEQLRALGHLRPLRPSRAPWAALPPGTADRDRVPHDQLPDRTRPRRPDRSR
jgi:hypothetical protein